MFIDRTIIEVRSGKGGDGVIAFIREKHVPRGGPAGGNGGRGASIYLRASKTVNTLFNFRRSKVFIGDKGGNGGNKNQYGRCAEDIIVDVPLGTVVFLEKDKTFLGDLSVDGKTLLVAKGGRGGRGNACFKSSTNRAPKIAENGEPGEKHRLILELKLLADVGLVGFPNVGKSTLLSVVSAATPEIADYPFTTIVPNLGVVSVKDGSSFVMADLPGLIKGAHTGRGLGLRFLRHVERCRIIVHMIDMSETGRDPYEDYLTINKELAEYGFALIKRPQIIVASKIDEEGALEKLKVLKKQISEDIIPISALTEENIDELLYRCSSLLKTTPAFPLFDEDEEALDHKVYTLEEEEPYFTITRLDAHTWSIGGEKMLNFYRMTNIENDEGIMVLMSKIRSLRIDDALENLGAKNGDTVLLDDFEFDYIK
ncbi:MAG: GTPase ObgE [Erysipelotrichia bacterium]|nr:GTPase ObgE [Erysipelotrichia bacterium]